VTASSAPDGSLPSGDASFETIRFPVAGMVCGSCVARITRALRRLEGVSRVRVDLGREAVTVRREPAVAPDGALAAAIREAGYEPHLEAAGPADPSDALGFVGRLLARAGRS
jgi:Cu+-exporting ATPase